MKRNELKLFIKGVIRECGIPIVRRKLGESPDEIYQDIDGKS